jgi:hypothetical protein
MGELPPFDAKWWVANRKAAVLTAVRGGKITLEEALRRRQLSEEELLIRANRSGKCGRQEPGSPDLSPRKSLNDGSRLLERASRTRHRKRIRKRVLGTILFVLGILLWVITTTLFYLVYWGLVSLDRIEHLSAGVVAGGAFVVAGIIRITTSA